MFSRWLCVNLKRPSFVNVLRVFNNFDATCRPENQKFSDLKFIAGVEMSNIGLNELKLCGAEFLVDLCVQTFFSKMCARSEIWEK
jgi:hypothetical protein